MSELSIEERILLDEIGGIKLNNTRLFPTYVYPEWCYKSPYSDCWINKRKELIYKAKKKISRKNKLIINSLTFLAFIVAILLAGVLAYFIGKSAPIFGVAMGLYIFGLNCELKMKYETDIRFIEFVRRGKKYW